MIELNKIMENIYDNSKVKKKNLDLMRNERDIVKDKIEKYLKEKNINCSGVIKNQGSYALNTMMYIPSEKDMDIDMALIFNEYNKNELIAYKNDIFTYLKKELKKYKLKMGKCAIQIIHKAYNMHFDIVIYTKLNDDEFLLWDDKLIVDNKIEEIKELKSTLCGEYGKCIKKMIILLKCIYKSISNEKVYNIEINDKNKLASIIINELVIQFFNKLNDNEKKESCGDILINILEKSSQNFDKKFILKTSNENEENLFNNYKRKLDENETKLILQKICEELKKLKNSKDITNDMEIMYKYYNHNENRFLMLSEMDYYAFKLSKSIYDPKKRYKKTSIWHHFNKKLNKKNFNLELDDQL
jgi:galactitol-specific phosphotransferase system IIB component